MSIGRVGGRCRSAGSMRRCVGECGTAALPSLSNRMCERTMFYSTLALMASQTSRVPRTTKQRSSSMLSTAERFDEQRPHQPARDGLLPRRPARQSAASPVTTSPHTGRSSTPSEHSSPLRAMRCTPTPSEQSADESSSTPPRKTRTSTGPAQRKRQRLSPQPEPMASALYKTILQWSGRSGTLAE
jgi:hypothetical protein